MSYFSAGFHIGIIDGLCKNFFGFSPLWHMPVWSMPCCRPMSFFSPMSFCPPAPFGFVSQPLFMLPSQPTMHTMSQYSTPTTLPPPPPMPTYQQANGSYWNNNSIFGTSTYCGQTMDFYAPQQNYQKQQNDYSYAQQTWMQNPQTLTVTGTKQEVADNISSATASKTSTSFNSTASTVKTNTSSNGSSAKMKHWSKMTPEEIQEVYGNYTKKITDLYTGTAEDLNRYLKGQGKLEGMGQAFIDAQNKYGVSASVLVGITANESARGTSKLAKKQNNVGGVRIAGSTKFKSYNSVADCIDDMARFLKSGYIDQGLITLSQVNAKYCPASDPTDRSGNNSNWARAVNKFASEVEKFV